MLSAIIFLAFLKSVISVSLCDEDLREVGEVRGERRFFANRQ